MRRIFIILTLLLIGCSKNDTDNLQPIDNVQQFKDSWGRKVWEDKIQSSCVDLSGEGLAYLQLNIDGNSAFTKALFLNWRDVIEYCGQGLNPDELDYINELTDENLIQRECESIPYEDQNQVIEITSQEVNEILITTTFKFDQSRREVKYIVYPNVLPVEMYEYRRDFDENGNQIGDQITRIWSMSDTIESVGCFRN